MNGQQVIDLMSIFTSPMTVFCNHFTSPHKWVFLMVVQRNNTGNTLEGGLQHDQGQRTYV